LEPQPRFRERNSLLEVDVNRLGSAFLFLACGSLGAVLSVTFLLMIPTDGGELITDDLPVLVIAAGMGFAAGAMIALLWSVLQRFFAVNAPRA
jgi:acyl-coenzyme A synthetase/AMP-(fatty) acid ligase